jgi:pimeloyl-ACP methyl ester carboxylesterase
LERLSCLKYHLNNTALEFIIAMRAEDPALTLSAMKPKTKYLLLALLIMVVAGFSLLNALAYNHAYAMTHFTAGGSRTKGPEKLSIPAKLKTLFVGVNIPRPASARSPSDLSRDCRVLTIAGGKDRLTLSAWYCNRGNETPLVILFHGYATEKTSLLPEARMFLDLGASVLLVDFRGSGDSSESYTTIGVHEAEDVAAVARYARGNLPHSVIVLFGQSMGAVAILRAIQQHGVAPEAVILEAVFDTLFNTARNRFNSMGVPSFPSAYLLVFWGGRQWKFNSFSHNAVEYAKSLNCPALFIHGANDPRATVAEGRRVFAAVPGPKEFKVFKSAGHGSCASLYPDEWKAAVAKVIREAEKKHLLVLARHIRPF